MDDVTWVVEGEGLLDLVLKMEECSERSLRWAEGTRYDLKRARLKSYSSQRSKNKGGSKEGGQFRWESKRRISQKRPQDGQGNNRHLPVHPLGYSDGREQASPGRALTRLSASKIRAKAHGPPQGHHGPEVILERRGTQLTERLW